MGSGGETHNLPFTVAPAHAGWEHITNDARGAGHTAGHHQPHIELIPRILGELTSLSHGQAPLFSGRRRRLSTHAVCTSLTSLIHTAGTLRQLRTNLSIGARLHIGGRGVVAELRERVSLHHGRAERVAKCAQDGVVVFLQRGGHLPRQREGGWDIGEWVEWE